MLGRRRRDLLGAGKRSIENFVGTYLGGGCVTVCNGKWERIQRVLCFSQNAVLCGAVFELLRKRFFLVCDRREV